MTNRIAELERRLEEQRKRLATTPEHRRMLVRQTIVDIARALHRAKQGAARP